MSFIASPRSAMPLGVRRLAPQPCFELVWITRHRLQQQLFLRSILQMITADRLGASPAGVGRVHSVQNGVPAGSI